MVAKPVPQCNRRPVGSVAVHHTGRNHLQAFIRQARIFSKDPRPTLAEVMEVIDVSSSALYRSARRKNALIMVALEFLYCRPNCILVYPPFDYKDIRIDAMGYRKKWVNAFQNKSADEQKSGNDDQPATPGKRPSLLAIKQCPISRGRGVACANGTDELTLFCIKETDPGFQFPQNINERKRHSAHGSNNTD